MRRLVAVLSSCLFLAACQDRAGGPGGDDASVPPVDGGTASGDDAAISGDGGAPAPLDGGAPSDGGPGPVDPPPACPSGVICIDHLPFTHRGTTAGAASDRFDRYGCAATTDESGPEVVYRVDLTSAGFLALDLPEGSMPAGVDVDVHLLESDSASSCLSRGHLRAGAYLPAGSYFIAVDTWVDAGGVEHGGAYTLDVGFTAPTALSARGMSAAAAEDALQAFDIAFTNGDTDRFEYAVTDFSLSSERPRQWVLDLSTGAVLFELHVAHGEGTSDPADSRYARTFSNASGSHQSSLGMMRAAETYTGTYGHSLRLDGLEPGYNDAVRPRAIVVHPWEGSRDDYVAYFGETAPTWGCPAVDDRISADVIAALQGGALLFYWYPDGDWSARSSYLR